jgi:thiol:disulfide interchange protein
MFLMVALLLAGSYVPVTKYDPKRNAEADIQAAVGEAQRTGRRVLIEVGGDWCSWCHKLDAYFTKNPKLTALRDSNFITLKVNWSPQNENKKALSKYPKISGYPHIFILDAQGKLLHSQPTGLLEEGQSYNLKKFTDFLMKWSPRKP